MDDLSYLCLVFAMLSSLFISAFFYPVSHFVVTCWESADLLSLVCDV